jgi:6-phosphogluconolactonase
VYVPYKGIDRIGQYDFDAASGKLTPLPVPFVTAPKGSGPRHLVLHPTLPWSYAIDEKTSTISRYGVERSSGALRYVDSISSLPPSFAGTNTGAEIQVSPNGKYVYASNRGHDSIAVFEVNASSGALSPKEWVPSGGKTPRMFALSPSGHWAAVANQDSGNVALFRVDPEAGTWQPLPSTIAIDKPSWVGLVEP